MGNNVIQHNTEIWTSFLGFHSKVESKYSQGCALGGPG